MNLKRRHMAYPSVTKTHPPRDDAAERGVTKSVKQRNDYDSSGKRTVSTSHFAPCKMALAVEPNNSDKP